MDEFSPLFAAAWRDPGAPTAALTDWILENVTTEAGRMAKYVYDKSDEHLPGVGNLLVFVPHNLPEEPPELCAEFTDLDLQIRSVRWFHRERFAADFPGWLHKELDDLYYILSK